MANQGAKKRKEENARHMARLRLVIIACSILAFGAYQSFGFIKGFLPQGSEESYEDEKTRKKREKMEKKASRPKFVKTRTR